ncbi:GTPase [uncultured Winogradskyella sp.]|uniref:GTPase n=1 Tax=uncultured Winogradskyella sp. TaxID=395353 RepID=UPI0030DB8CB4|tara:strand:+ start:25421 stop:25768 length:348 start_codon:yes stop_codon:yes gene_type:complete
MKLLYVYNANSGKLNALFNTGNKLFRFSKYQCSLCTLTYDTFTEKEVWKAFREDADLDMEFYHKDEFETKFSNVKIRYPSILKLEKNQITTIINDEILNEISGVEAMIKLLKLQL